MAMRRVEDLHFPGQFGPLLGRGAKGRQRRAFLPALGEGSQSGRGLPGKRRAFGRPLRPENEHDCLIPFTFRRAYALATSATRHGLVRRSLPIPQQDRKAACPYHEAHHDNGEAAWRLLFFFRPSERTVVIPNRSLATCAHPRPLATAKNSAGC